MRIFTLNKVAELYIRKNAGSPKNAVDSVLDALRTKEQVRAKKPVEFRHG